MIAGSPNTYFRDPFRYRYFSLLWMIQLDTGHVKGMVTGWASEGSSSIAGMVLKLTCVDDWVLLFTY